MENDSDIIGLELCDAGILAASGDPPQLLAVDGDGLESPGVAFVNGRTVTVGQSAEALCRRHPNRSTDRFWDPFDTEPWKRGREVPFTRAELAFHHLEAVWGKYDLYFLHFKDTDTRGHDGDFEGKVQAIQEVDRLLPRVLGLDPDVVIVTGDHSTPTLMKEHSWHPVPTLMASALARPTATAFGESSCRAGDLGIFHGTHLIPHALAHAGRLIKFGA